MIFGIRGIEESWVYQDILAKGRAEGEARGEARGAAKGAIDEARSALLRLGRKKLGEPDARVLALLANLDDLDRLNLLLEGVIDAHCWDDLFPQLPS